MYQGSVQLFSAPWTLLCSFAVSGLACTTDLDMSVLDTRCCKRLLTHLTEAIQKKNYIQKTVLLVAFLATLLSKHQGINKQCMKWQDGPSNRLQINE